jgi:hypothetical protein
MSSFPPILSPEHVILCTLEFGKTFSDTFFSYRAFFGLDVTGDEFVFDRVARWFIFKPKIPLWVNFGKP